MTDETITLDEEAYELLRSRKRDGENFSDVVERLAGERSWRAVAGIWSDDTDYGRDLEALVAEGREQSRERSNRIAEELHRSRTR